MQTNAYGNMTEELASTRLSAAVMLLAGCDPDQDGLVCFGEGATPRATIGIAEDSTRECPIFLLRVGADDIQLFFSFEDAVRLRDLLKVAIESIDRGVD
jgi:hypothetical protein